MAMLSWEIMPPPKTLEKTLLEQRLTNHAPTGITVCPALDVEQVLSGIQEGNKAERQRALADAAWHAVEAAYIDLEKAAHDSQYRQSSGTYSQPWKQ
jgi:glycerol-3-phosphate O-acyltransferase